MTDRALVFSKASRVRGRLARIRDGLSRASQGSDQELDRVEQVAFNVFLAMQECLDLASHIVADEGWGVPATLAEAFDILGRNGVIGATTATDMRKGTRLRNLIAHAYGDIDAVKLFASARPGLDQIEAFLGEVALWVERRGVAG